MYILTHCALCARFRLRSGSWGNCYYKSFHVYMKRWLVLKFEYISYLQSWLAWVYKNLSKILEEVLFLNNFMYVCQLCNKKKSFKCPVPYLVINLRAWVTYFHDMYCTHPLSVSVCTPKTSRAVYRHHWAGYKIPSQVLKACSFGCPRGWGRRIMRYAWVFYQDTVWKKSWDCGSVGEHAGSLDAIPSNHQTKGNQAHCQSRKASQWGTAWESSFNALPLQSTGCNRELGKGIFSSYTPSLVKKCRFLPANGVAKYRSIVQLM